MLLKGAISILKKQKYQPILIKFNLIICFHTLCLTLLKRQRPLIYAVLYEVNISHLVLIFSLYELLKYWAIYIVLTSSSDYYYYTFYIKYLNKNPLINNLVGYMQTYSKIFLSYLVKVGISSDSNQKVWK